MRRCATTGESGDSQVHRPPEQVDWAALSDEARTELEHYAFSLHQHPPKAIHRIAVVIPVNFIDCKRDGLRYLVRPRDDAHGEIQPDQLVHQSMVERGYRLRLERETAAAAVTRSDREAMFHQIEIDLKLTVAVRNRRRGEPTRRHVKRGMPRMVDPRRLNETDLSDDLQPHVQGISRCEPLMQFEYGPGASSMRLNHCAIVPGRLQ